MPSMFRHSGDPSGGHFSFDLGRSGLDRGVEFIDLAVPSESISHFDLNTVAIIIQEEVESEEEEPSSDAFIRTLVLDVFAIRVTTYGLILREEAVTDLPRQQSKRMLEKNEEYGQG
ncbi:hypothetical protein HN873_051868, partial [Arachis hypogaea]